MARQRKHLACVLEEEKFGFTILSLTRMGLYKVEPFENLAGWSQVEGAIIERRGIIWGRAWGSVGMAPIKQEPYGLCLGDLVPCRA
jgi:hypothetical protein